MKKKNTRSRGGLHGSLLAIIVVFVLTASAAFPTPWNKTVDAIGFGPKYNEDGFRLGLDLQGGTHLVYEADMSNITSEDRGSALDGVRDVIERRVNAFGVSEPSIVTNISGGHYRIFIELAGVFNVNEAIALIGETPILEFKIPKENIDDVEVTKEQQEQIDEAQDSERKIALDVLNRALDSEDFGDLVREFSENAKTKEDGGYYGFVKEDDAVFGELAKQITKEKMRVGIVDGLYETESRIFIVNYLSKDNEEAVNASHILVCYTGATRCERERSQEEAQIIAQDLLSQATKKNFSELAKTNSDDPSAESLGGALGTVSPGQMVPAFDEALFAMKDGAISEELVETEFGYHIIYRQNSHLNPKYEISVLEMPWTTVSDVVDIDPWDNTALSGKHIKSAAVAFDQNSNVPYVELTFNTEGGDLFGALTEARVGEVIGIFLDGMPISTPVVQQAIYGGSATITGSFTVEEAKTLSRRLNAGALPVSIELISEQTVGPTLGHLSFDQSIKAALIGLVLVALFMILYYRLPGLISVLSLLIYASVNLALYKWLPGGGVTLTLSGIAGFILSLGMAVDANVLIFERLKEELQSGRDLTTAIDEGFRRAWTSIRDGNVTTLIAAAVLFSMGTSFIKGFALTLGLGILVSMLTAILVTRMLLKWFTQWKLLKSKWLYNGKKS